MNASATGLVSYVWLTRKVFGYGVPYIRMIGSKRTAAKPDLGKYPAQRSSHLFYKVFRAASTASPAEDPDMLKLRWLGIF